MIQVEDVVVPLSTHSRRHGASSGAVFLECILRQDGGINDDRQKS